MNKQFILSHLLEWFLCVTRDEIAYLQKRIGELSSGPG
jgi:hypothetical protein